MDSERENRCQSGMECAERGCFAESVDMPEYCVGNRKTEEQEN